MGCRAENALAARFSRIVIVEKTEAGLAGEQHAHLITLPRNTWKPALLGAALMAAFLSVGLLTNTLPGFTVSPSWFATRRSLHVNPGMPRRHYRHLTPQQRVALAGFDGVKLDVRISDLPPAVTRNPLSIRTELLSHADKSLQYASIRVVPHSTDARLIFDLDFAPTLTGGNHLYSVTLRLERKATLTNGGRDPLGATVWRGQSTDVLTPHHLSCCFDQTVMPIATGIFTSFASQVQAANLPPNN